MGTNGAYEAAYHGVPLVAAPVLAGDGYDNYLRFRKMARYIDVYSADVKTWVQTIEDVVYNTK